MQVGLELSVLAVCELAAKAPRPVTNRQEGQFKIRRSDWHSRVGFEPSVLAVVNLAPQAPCRSRQLSTIKKPSSKPGVRIGIDPGLGFGTACLENSGF